MGTPDFAVPSLEALLGAGHEVVGVFSQPDRPVGRHQNRLQPTPVKACAQARGVPVFQPEKLRDGAALAVLKELDPELIVVAAYGRVLPDDILALSPKGCINVHSSLLPRYRGAAPINWAILNGDGETGVTIMDMVHELDAGDILAQVSTPIDPAEDAAGLFDRLSRLGGELLTKTGEQIEAGTAMRAPPDPEQVSYAPMLSKALSPVDWTRPAQAIHDQIRGLIPWPGASTDALTGETLKLWRSRVADRTSQAAPGTVLSAGPAGIDVACGGGSVLTILELQAPGSRRMGAGDYLRGHPLEGVRN